MGSSPVQRSLPKAGKIAGERRRRLTHRAMPALAALAAISLLAGTLVGSAITSAEERTARDFAAAWERGDLRAMHDLLSDSARSRYPLARFRRAYRRAAATATLTRVEAGDPEASGDGLVTLPVVVTARVFGRLAGQVELPVSAESVDWQPHLAFPELRDGERLTRESFPPDRATLLARGGEVLAEGAADARSSPQGALAASIAGVLEPAEQAAERRSLYAFGFPESWPVGTSGLERVFERRLRGRPGGELRAGRRVLARARPRAAAPVRPSIDTNVQEAAVTALEEELVEPRTEFPVESAAVVDGVELENANGEFCGGSFRDSFAHSCNSVFGPLGVEVGSEGLVDAAERYGWNAEPIVAGEAPSTLPPASE